MTAIAKILWAKVFVGAEERYWANEGEELRFEIKVQNVGDETGTFFTQVREAQTGMEITPFTVWGQPVAVGQIIIQGWQSSAYAMPSSAWKLNFMTGHQKSDGGYLTDDYELVTVMLGPHIQVEITGTIVDADTGQGLVAAFNFNGITFSSDSTGAFSKTVPLEPNVDYLLTITRDGYKTITDTYNYSSDGIKDYGTLPMQKITNGEEPDEVPETIFDTIWAKFLEFSEQLGLPVPPKPQLPPLPFESE